MCLPVDAPYTFYVSCCLPIWATQTASIRITLKQVAVQKENRISSRYQKVTQLRQNDKVPGGYYESPTEGELIPFYDMFYLQQNLILL